MKENCQGEKLAGNDCRVKESLRSPRDTECEKVCSQRFPRVRHAQEKIGATGFEPATSWSQTKRSTKLSYAPEPRRLRQENTIRQAASEKFVLNLAKLLGSQGRHQFRQLHTRNHRGSITDGKGENQFSFMQ